MSNTKNTKGQITKFGQGADLEGLDDGTSKIHSGILKALFAIATGNYISAVGANGVSQSDVGGFTRFTLNGDIVFYRNGERFEISGNLTKDYTGSDAADSSTDRYDLLVLKANNTLDFRKGSITGADTDVGVLEDKDVPVCLIKVTANSSANATTRPLQLYTAVDGDKSISITNAASDFTGHSIIQNLLVDKDIIFKGNDNNGTNGANISALTLDMSEAGKALFNVGAAFQKDVTIYEDANNADVSLSLGTGAAESLTISVLNGASNKTAEVVSFATATASGTANHGKMIFDVDGANIATIEDGGIDLAAGKTFSINGTDMTSGSITALNNKAADRLVTIGATTTELDGEANLTFNGSTNALAVTGSMTASTTIQATTSVTSAAIVGTTSVTGAIVTSNGELVTNGLRKTMYEMVEQSILPVPTFNHHIVYVDDISNIGTLLGLPQVNNQVILPAPADMTEFKIINTHAANPITIIPSAGTINLGLTTHGYIGSANVITLAPSQGVHLQAVNDSQPPLQVGWMITGIAGL